MGPGARRQVGNEAERGRPLRDDAQRGDQQWGRGGEGGKRHREDMSVGDLAREVLGDKGGGGLGGGVIPQSLPTGSRAVEHVRTKDGHVKQDGGVRVQLEVGPNGRGRQRGVDRDVRGKPRMGGLRDRLSYGGGEKPGGPPAAQEGGRRHVVVARQRVGAGVGRDGRGQRADWWGRGASGEGVAKPHRAQHHLSDREQAGRDQGRRGGGARSCCDARRGGVRAKVGVAKNGTAGRGRRCKPSCVRRIAGRTQGADTDVREHAVAHAQGGPGGAGEARENRVPPQEVAAEGAQGSVASGGQGRAGNGEVAAHLTSGADQTTAQAGLGRGPRVGTRGATRT